MTTTVQEVYCFRIKQVSAEDGDTTFWRYAKDHFRADYEPAFSPKIDDASKFTLDQTEAIVAFYHKLMKNPKVVGVEFVKVTVSTTIDIIPMDKDELLEERRRVALNKLNPDDIYALGVEGLATYSKLKYHAPKKRSLSESDF